MLPPGFRKKYPAMTAAEATNVFKRRASQRRKPARPVLTAVIAAVTGPDGMTSIIGMLRVCGCAHVCMCARAPGALFAFPIVSDFALRTPSHHQSPPPPPSPTHTSTIPA